MHRSGVFIFYNLIYSECFRR